jgi:hypothetical protein
VGHSRPVTGLLYLFYKTVVFDQVYVLFHFNIMLKHNGMSSSEMNRNQFFIYVMLHLSLHTLKVRGGVELWLHLFRTSTRDGGGCLASRRGRFTPGER